MKRLLLLVVAIASVALATGVGVRTAAGSPRPQRYAGPSVNGGGSTFAAVEVDQWVSEVAQNPFNLTVNYAGVGSTGGRTQYMDGSFDYAGSDIPFQPNELNNPGLAARPYVYVPVSAGGLAMMYNLVDTSGNPITKLNLTRRATCMIFTVPNMYWDDPEIAGANPGLALPHHLLRPVVRSDGSGTSFVLSEYCLAAANDVWSTFVTARVAAGGAGSLDPEFEAGRPTSKWPSGWGIAADLPGADLAAAEVAQSQYSITYNAATYGVINGLPLASVENGARAFVQPTEEAVTVALAYADGRADGTFSLNFDGPDPTAYFPSTYSYVIAQSTGYPADKGEVLARFLCYAVTKGQRVELTKNLGYARLSAPLVDIARRSIAQIPGAPPWEQCKVEAPPPPPAATTIAPRVPSGGNGGGGNAGGGNAGGGNAGGAGEGAVVTSIVIDPVTGSSVVVTVPSARASGAGAGNAPGKAAGNSAGAGNAPVNRVTGSSIAARSGECLDPATGLPADPTSCLDTGGVAVASAGQAVNGQQGPAAAVVPQAVNPPVVSDAVGPSGATIAWWLIQGATVCAVGVSLAGVRRRLA
jgi:phosphate transport system substrate-binding protein